MMRNLESDHDLSMVNNVIFSNFPIILMIIISMESISIIDSYHSN